VVVLGCGVDSIWIEPGRIELTRPVIPLPNLPPAWDGVRIAHLADLHFGGINDLGFMQRVVALVNAEKPDLVVNVGDFGGWNDDTRPQLSRALAGIEAPLGSLAVLGNHDYDWFAVGVEKMLADAGIRLIDNDRVVLDRRGEKLAVAGVGDLDRSVQDLSAALADLPADAGRVLLTHNPDYAELMPAAPRVDLMLCGHTHGGKINLPLIGTPILPIKHRQYAAGLARGPHCPVYTSRGIGTTNPPIRFRCRPELPIITLRRAGQT